MLLINKLLRKASAELKKEGSPTPDLDARILMEHALDKDSIFVLTHADRPITHSEYGKFRRYIRRRKKGEPVAYITGTKEFFGSNFLVNKNVLIPRPETEWLIERGIELIKNQSTTNNQPLTILDIGTGSGCIIISIINALTTDNCQLTTNFYASDLSAKAIGVAKKNAQKFGLKKRIIFVKSYLFQNRLLHKKFDIIFANLPYVPHRKNRKSKIENLNIEFDPIAYEPHSAIFADSNGTKIIEKFLKEAKNFLSPKGIMLLELDPRNAKEIFNFAKKEYSDAKINLTKDLAGLNRYLEIKK